MESRPTEKGSPGNEKRQLKKSVHRCPRCNHPVDLKQLTMREATTGLITCPKCEWSGPIAIGVVAKE